MEPCGVFKNREKAEQQQYAPYQYLDKRIKSIFPLSGEQFLAGVSILGFASNRLGSSFFASPKKSRLSAR